jgi:glucose-1-phosphate adenylyltransferase
VIVEAGAVVERSILMHDVRVETGAHLTEAIVDKEAIIGPGAIVGGTGEAAANRRYPTHLDGGQVLIGKGARVPADARIERNAILFPSVSLPRGAHSLVSAGETIGDLDR